MAARFTNDFKTTILDLYNSGKTAMELSREYGISTQVIYKWKNESRGETSKSSENEELIALRQENARLKVENDILKKATAIFARKV